MYKFLLPALGVCMIAAPAVAGQSHMTTASITSQPIGHYRFCQQFPDECKDTAIITKAPRLTRKGWADIVEINNFANTSILPVTDQELYGVEEHWTYPEHEGDCEDYVLLKRHMLMQRGWPASSLLITVVKQDNGDGHAVLTVRTDKADYILDNLEDKVKPWYKTPYLYVKRISTKHSGLWTDIRDNRRELAKKRLQQLRSKAAGSTRVRKQKRG